LGDGVLELDRKGTILSATPGACELLGKREARVIGERFVSFCPRSLSEKKWFRAHNRGPV
jgi:PAS domain-containing protein